MSLSPSVVCARLGVAALVAACGGLSSVHADDREIDGSLNNPSSASMGAANTQLGRKTNGYDDGIWTMRQGPNPRAISNGVFAQSGSMLNDRGLTDFTWAWGQFLDHDIDLSPDSSGEAANIQVPQWDPQFDPTGTGTVEMPFNRTGYDPSSGTRTDNPRQQMNVITTWIDGSNVYGSDTDRANWLRAPGGKLKSQSTAAGEFLPFNDGTQSNAGGPGTNLFVGGDIRANEHAVLSSMHTLFLREHNRLADEIAAENPGWSDDEIYERARKIVGAEIQAVTYNEFLPALIGEGQLEPAQYGSSVDASIDNEFSTAAYRLGHSMLSSTILRLDENRQVIDQGNLSLADAFFRPDKLLSGGGTDPLFRGLAANEMQEVDSKVIDDVRNLLFGQPEDGGLDLASLNIQRGRDHGLGTYNDVRAAYGLAPAGDFDDITTDPAVALALSDAYGGDISLLDPWVGMLAEDHVDGASVGALVQKILADQFSRLRNGDRYFFEWDGDMDQELVAELHGLRLSDIILRNTEIAGIQRNVFFVPGPAGVTLLGLGGLVAFRRRRCIG